MVNPFSYFLKTKIQFGAGVSGLLMDALDHLGSGKIMLVTDKTLLELGILDKILSLLDKNGREYVVFDQVEPNPKVETVDGCRDMCRKENCEIFLAVGGGSVMDTAKGAAVLMTNPGSIHDYLMGRKEQGKEVKKDALPMIAVPTTSGTGAEVSDCIVVIDTNQIKDLMIADQLAPDYAFVDPELTYGLPSVSTAYTGLDVLGHALEAYTSTAGNGIAELMALEAIKLVFSYLPACVQEAVDEEQKKEARSEMAYASLLAGIAQSKCGCTIPHALSCPLTVYEGIPHGLGVGITQIPAIRYNRECSAEQYAAILNYMGEKVENSQAANTLIDKITRLFDELSIPLKIRLKEYGAEQLRMLARDAMEDDGVLMNPKKVTQEDLIQMYREIIR